MRDKLLFYDLPSSSIVNASRTRQNNENCTRILNNQKMEKFNTKKIYKYKKLESLLRLFSTWGNLSRFINILCFCNFFGYFLVGYIFSFFMMPFFMLFLNLLGLFYSCYVILVLLLILGLYSCGIPKIMQFESCMFFIFNFVSFFLKKKFKPAKGYIN